jgi:hypothetical protein
MHNEAPNQQAQAHVVPCSSCRIASIKTDPHRIERGALCITCGERTHNGFALCGLCARSTATGRRQIIKLPQNEWAFFQEIRKKPLRDGLYEISMDAPGQAFSGCKNVKQLAQAVKNKLVERGVLEIVTVGGPQRRTVVRILNDNVQLSNGRGRPAQERLQYPIIASEPKAPASSAGDAVWSALVLPREDRASGSASLNLAGQVPVAMPGGYESPDDRTGAAETSVAQRRRYTKRLRAFSQQTETDILESVKTIGIVRTAHEYNSSYVYVSKLCKSRGMAIPLGRMKKAA